MPGTVRKGLNRSNMVQNGRKWSKTCHIHFYIKNRIKIGFHTKKYGENDWRDEKIKFMPKNFFFKKLIGIIF